LGVILGDCLEKMKDIPEKSIDMILTDLPYGMTFCKWDSEISLDKLWEQWLRICKKNTPIVLTSSQPFTSKLVMSKPELFKTEWIWQKTRHTNFMNLKYQPAKIHESIVVFGQETVNYHPIKWYVDEDKIDKRKTVRDPDTNKDGYIGTVKRTRKKDDGSRYPQSIIKIKNSNNNTLHPTQKPIELFEYLIKTYTNEGDIVLDCCAGSGTTAIACINTNRKYICIEKDQKYYDIINQRLGETNGCKLS